MNIIITPRYMCEHAFDPHQCSHIISIQEAVDCGPMSTPKGIHKDAHWQFFFDDVTKDYGNESIIDNKDRVTKRYAPTLKDVTDILYKIEMHQDRIVKLMIHCMAGVSRSSAIAFAAFCQFLGPGKEVEAMDMTEKAALLGGIWPNDLIVEYADKYLGREGNMIKVLADWKKKEKEKYTRVGVSF